MHSKFSSGQIRNRCKARLLGALKALPSDTMPKEITTAEGRHFRFLTCFKHDCWAATGLYAEITPVPSSADAPVPLAVLKINRINTFFGLPLRAIGRFLTRREVKAYRLCQHVQGVPAFCGILPDHSGLLHAYVPGHHLRPDDRLPAAFFTALSQLLAELHALDLAFVDLNKPQNIILGEDNRPYLTDFQIYFHTHTLILRWLLRLLQNGDRYHVIKHKYRLRRDLCTPAEIQLMTQRPWFIRLHRWLFRPYFKLRRFVLYKMLQARRSE
jgi:hypothetical protein